MPMFLDELCTQTCLNLMLVRYLNANRNQLTDQSLCRCGHAVDNPDQA